MTTVILVKFHPGDKFKIIIMLYIMYSTSISVYFASLYSAMQSYLHEPVRLIHYFVLQG